LMIPIKAAITRRNSRADKINKRTSLFRLYILIC